MNIQSIAIWTFKIIAIFLLIWITILYFLGMPYRIVNNNGKIFPSNNLVNLDDEKIKLEDFLGEQNTIIDFWFLGCKPCLKEMENFPQIIQENKGLNIVSVSVDSYEFWKTAISNVVGDTSVNQKVKKIITKSNISNLLELDNQNWKHLNYKIEGIKGFPEIKELSINSYPTYYLLDKEGKIMRGTNSIHDIIERKESSIPGFFYEAKDDLKEGALWQMVLFFYLIILLIIGGVKWLVNK